jgi:hypothetical protein
MGERHEAPAPIGQKAQPAAAGRSRKTAEAVNKKGRGLRSAPIACWIRDDADVREAYEASIAAIPATPGTDF